MESTRIYKCDIDNCTSKFKSGGDLKSHKSYVHDIGVKWYKCDIDNCDSKFKSGGELKSHKSCIHDIGKHKCDICFRNKNSQIHHTYMKMKMSICKVCFKKLTNKTSRIEIRWNDYINTHLDGKQESLVSSDKSLKSLGGCQMYRPDRIYIGVDIVEIDECDEHQHKDTNGNYSCDEKRISDIYNEKGIIGKNLVVIRWNPHKYKVNKNQKCLPLKVRLEMIVELKRKLRFIVLKDKIHIYYMFFDYDNKNISKNYPITHIRTRKDISNIN